MVLARCRKCGKTEYIPEFRLGGVACDECLTKMGKPLPRPNRGLFKRKRHKVTALASS
jgi:hypothetical protein